MRGGSYIRIDPWRVKSKPLPVKCSWSILWAYNRLILLQISIETHSVISIFESTNSNFKMRRKSLSSIFRAWSPDLTSKAHRGGFLRCARVGQCTLSIRHRVWREWPVLVKCNFLENMSSPQIFVLSLDIEIFKDRALTVEHTHKYHSLKHIIKKNCRTTCRNSRIQSSQPERGFSKFLLKLTITIIKFKDAPEIALRIERIVFSTFTPKFRNIFK